MSNDRDSRKSQYEMWHLIKKLFVDNFSFFSNLVYFLLFNFWPLRISVDMRTFFDCLSFKLLPIRSLYCLKYYSNKKCTDFAYLSHAVVDLCWNFFSFFSFVRFPCSFLWPLYEIFTHTLFCSCHSNFLFNLSGVSHSNDTVINTGTAINKHTSAAARRKCSCHQMSFHSVNKTSTANDNKISRIHVLMWLLFRFNGSIINISTDFLVNFVRCQW